MSGFRRTHRLNLFFRTVPLTEKESWHGRSITVFYTERHMFDELSNRNFPAVVNFRRRILTSGMMLYDDFREILKIQKFRRIVGYTTFYCFTAALTYFYTNNTTRAGYSRGDQFYAAYPAGTELLTDSAKLYKAALGNCFETEEWGPIEFCVMARHFDRQGKAPYAYHAQHMAHLLSLGQLDGSG